VAVIAVTGASRGLGKALALRLASEGHKVCALARSEERLKALRVKYPENIKIYSVDISKAKEVEETFGSITEEFGAIYALVNNAAVHSNQHFVDETIENMNRLVDINVKGMLYCTRAALPGMIEKKGGYVINISSTAVLHGTVKHTLYTLTKHAVVGFGEVLAQELLPHGIMVITLIPGGIATPLWNSEKNPYPGNAEDLMKPERIADLVSYLMKQPKGILFKKIVFFPVSEWHWG
jgi:NADP-dependent 3-hydroxy acid dehydrogenase YdfG